MTSCASSGIKARDKNQVIPFTKRECARLYSIQRHWLKRELRKRRAHLSSGFENVSFSSSPSLFLQRFSLKSPDGKAEVLLVHFSEFANGVFQVGLVS